MGDLPKPSDDAVWTELERSFFAGAPPEGPEPPGEPPRLDDLFPVLPPPRQRREILAWLRRAPAAAWRRTTLLLGAVSAYALRGARAGAAGLGAMLSLWHTDRRRVVYALAGGVVVGGLFAGVVTSRSRALTTAATVPTEAPVSVPAVAQATPFAQAMPVAQATPVVAPATRSRRADASNRSPRMHRKSAPASSSTERSVPTGYTDRETYWARRGQSAPVPAGRTFFNR